ncbi:MAG: type IV secretion system protein [Alphaproteobacteria bacterium]|jgi:type IV secretory pathway component VirB8|nr:hypothetical protein [Thalassospira sp.]MCE2964304.1 type IV secretion system protein [Alphaproteobacteria bacterium]
MSENDTLRDRMSRLLDKSTGGMHARLDPQIRAAPNQGQDRIGAYPANVGVPVLEGKRQLFTTRVFALAFYISMLFNIVLVFAVTQLVPLKRVEPFLVTLQDKSEQVVRIEPINKDASGFQLLLEAMAGEFVKNYEEIVLDTDEQQRRWREYVRPRMEEDPYVNFMRERVVIYPQLQSAQTAQTVAITRVVRKSQNFVEVYFTTSIVDRRGKELDKKAWVGLVKFGFRKQNIGFEERYLNPLGFTVFDYSRQEFR